MRSEVIDLFPKHSRTSRTWAYFYLANLIIPATFLFLLPRALELFGVALLLLFAVIYIASYRFGTRWRLFCAVFETILVMVMAGTLNAGYYWVGIYPFALLHITLTGGKRRLALSLVALAFLIQILVLLHLKHIPIVTALPYLILGIFGLLSFLISMRFQERNVAATDALKAANQEIKRLTELAERDRISQDLHDVMGHELSMITLKAQLIDRLVQRDPDRARVEVRDVEQAARKALARVREYIANIRRARLDEEWNAALQLLKTAGITCESPMPDFTAISIDEASETLAMCLREGVTNITRHSHATRALLTLQRKDDTLSVVVADNGLGLRKNAPDRSVTGRSVSEGDRARHGVLDHGERLTWSDDGVVDHGQRPTYSDDGAVDHGERSTGSGDGVLDHGQRATLADRQTGLASAFSAREDPATSWPVGNTHGLSGMRARLDAVDGTLAIWSNGRALHAEGTACPPCISWRRGLVLQFSVPTVMKVTVNEEALL